MVCGLIGEWRPGVQLIRQVLTFPNPTFAGDEVLFRAEVTGVNGSLLDLATTVTHSGNVTGLAGEARICDEGLAWDEPGDIAPRGEDVPLKGLAVGQTAQQTRTFSTEDVAAYADLAEDYNPLYTDPAYAARLGLANSLLPNGLIGGMFSYLMGTKLPGFGVNYLKQTLHFLAPAYPGEALTARMTITGIRAEKQLVDLRAECFNAAGERVCVGRSLLLAKDYHPG
ncbi:MAG: hypothetical protein GYB64_01495 [Chloroflexi bacterium]|nr:hypothetical protein [Chloroflexota bacterium]